MKKKEKIKKYTKIFETLLFITVVINILLFAYKKENILSRANYKILVQESEGSSNYVAYNGSKFPKSGYTFASYECENGGTVTQTSKGVFSYTGDSDSCVLKFDIVNSSCNDDSLYCVLANEAADGIYAGEYTGNGSSSFDNKVYYYKYNSENNNVYFANYCWKMVRTTDTGGVKLLFNGVKNSNGVCDGTTTYDDNGTTTTDTSGIIGKSKFNENSDSLAYVGYMYNTVYNYQSQTPGAYMYGNSFTYSNGTYTLTDTITTSGNATESDLTNHHYTCFNTEGTCTSISYIYYLSETTAYYITLTNGKNINDAINEMLYNADVNANDSALKTTTETWYANNMVNYTQYLEDTVYCNDRSTSDLGGWNPNNDVFSNSFYFSVHDRYITVTANSTTGEDYDFINPDFTCANTNDSFTVSTENGNGKLTYPVGFLTGDEASIAYEEAITDYDTYRDKYLAFYNDEEYSYLKTPVEYWLGSPADFSNYRAYDFAVGFGLPGFGRVDLDHGVRPVISLKPGTEYVDGDGSRNNPYIVGTKKSYTTLNKLQSLNSNIQVNSGTPDFSQIAETDEGVYSAEDDYGTSYYWRGAATTNYIKFGKNSSNQDLYWRIVRINGNGSLRLFYLGDDINDNDYISDVVFNNSDTSNAYLGYMYGDPNGSTFESTHANINSSSAKNALDNWYVSNIQGKTIEEYISDTEFCYDRSIIEENTGNGVGTNVTHYASYTRNYTNKSPSLLCTQKNDRFTVNDVGVGNGNLSKPIGLITLDEILMAGGNYEINEEHFLNGNIYYWTGTPIRFEYSEANVAFLTNEGDFDWVEVNAKKDLVPVINITPEAVSTLTGSGTVSDPFVVH